MLDAEAKTETVLEVSNIEVIYNHVILVLKGVSLKVPKGGITALLGGNGAGKTTTLKAISGLLASERGEVTKGTIHYHGENTAHADPADLVKAVDMPGYGYLFDSFHANIEEKNPWDALRRHAGQMTHVHVSENDRGTPGAGHIDFAAMFDVLREIDWDGWVTVEAFGAALPDIAAATKVWRPLFDDEDSLAREALALLRRTWSGAGAKAGLRR